MKAIYADFSGKWIGRRWGWHRMIYGRKPLSGRFRPLLNEQHYCIQFHGATYAFLKTLRPTPSAAPRTEFRGLGRLHNGFVPIGETSLDHQSFFAGPAGRTSQVALLPNATYGDGCRRAHDFL